MNKDVKVYKIENLKSDKEYYNELVKIHNELGVGVATDTLIKDDLKLLTRIDEIMVIRSFTNIGDILSKVKSHCEDKIENVSEVEYQNNAIALMVYKEILDLLGE